MELILPVLPDNENLEEMTWESTTQDFEIFKLLLSGWGVVELRLSAIAQFKNKNFADQLVKKAQQQRKQWSQKNQKLSNMQLDYLLLQHIHALIDAELVEVGEKFYLPTLRDLWKGYVPADVLNAQI